MKVALNLAIAPSARERYALAWAVPATLLGLAGLVFIVVSLGRQLWDYRKVHQEFGELQERTARLRKQESAVQSNLDQPQARKIFREAQFINALIEKKQISLSQLAAIVTKLLPGDARLAGLALAPQSGDLKVLFTITGRNEEAVETFLGNLEDSPEFKDVALVNEGFQQQGPTAGPITINCSAHYVMAPH
jgi:hypothetical protein